MKRFCWKIELQAEDGEVKTIEFQCAWSPEKDYITPISIGISAACQHSRFGDPLRRKWALVAEPRLIGTQDA